MPNDLPINKAEIRTLIPHSGLMCLLDQVTQWDDRSITCVTNTHRDPANPLRRNGHLSALHAFEYGAQAAAVHGGLHARSVGTTALPGYLAALDARNATALAMSSAVPVLPSGIFDWMEFLISSERPAVMSVVMNPGATALTVILRLASSRASDLVRPIKPALLAA